MTRSWQAYAGVTEREYGTKDMTRSFGWKALASAMTRSRIRARLVGGVCGIATAETHQATLTRRPFLPISGKLLR